jgi:hypothetical protein
MFIFTVAFVYRNFKLPSNTQVGLEIPEMGKQYGLELYKK